MNPLARFSSGLLRDMTGIPSTVCIVASMSEGKLSESDVSEELVFYSLGNIN